MRTTILDIVKHTGDLGFIEVIKVSGEENETIVEAMDKNRTVTIKGKLLKALPEFSGECGMANLSILKGLLTYPNFKADGASITVKRREQGSDSGAEEIVFKDEKGQTASYRLMNSKHIPSQAKFLGTWDIEVTPTVSKIKEFQALAGIYGSVETNFFVKVVDKELRFYIGEENSSMHRAFLTIAEDVEGSISGDLMWPIAQVLSIMKLGQDENLKISLCVRGALKISMTSPFAEYDFILPARKK